MPSSPETILHVHTVQRVFGGRAHFSFLVPNRTEFVAAFASLDVPVVHTPSETVGELLRRSNDAEPQRPANKAHATRSGTKRGTRNDDNDDYDHHEHDGNHDQPAASRSPLRDSEPRAGRRASAFRVVERSASASSLLVPSTQPLRASLTASLPARRPLIVLPDEPGGDDVSLSRRPSATELSSMRSPPAFHE